MHVELTLRTPPPVLTDFRGIMPESFVGLTASAIAATAVQVGNQPVPLGELFTIRLHPGDDSQATLHLLGDCSLIDNIGAGMRTGTLIVQGNCGDRAGAGMAGGKLLIHGQAGHALGQALAGGVILLEGSCGQDAGAAGPGASRGMTGGRIEIRGHAGAGLGAAMRRGWIEVHGDCGPHAATGMIAGTIHVRGRLGPYAGCGMIRGTIITHEFHQPGPGFVLACEYEPVFYRLVNRTTPQHRTKVVCYRGDLLTGGRGEIWLVSKPGP